ncbi:hypothetical protein [Streptomyces sp. C10]|uniref:hypothetical protein n=1 Tax=Streptomyces sp. C10 TaxID=531941 RepID=UPI003980F512
MRLRYYGTASRWGFALYDAPGDRYKDSHLPTGSGTPRTLSTPPATSTSPASAPDRG